MTRACLAAGVLHAAWLVAMVSQGLAQAQPAAPDKAALDPDAGVLVLPIKQGQPLHGGRLLYAQGVAGPGRDQRFGLEGLSVMQPVVVSVLPKDTNTALTLSVRKGSPAQPAAPGKSARAVSGGIASISFRTQSAARISVHSADGPAPYQLMVWVGPELRPPMASPFRSVRAGELRAADAAKR